MRDRGLYAAVAAVALATGSALWLLDRPGSAPSKPPIASPTISAAALYAATFVDTAGQSQSLGQFQGRLLLLNFWATWCAPCREEMPVLSNTASRSSGSGGLAVVGLSSEAAEAVRHFASDNAVSYPLWTGGAAVDALSERLGNTSGVLPYSVLVGPDGRVLEQKVGPYTQTELDSRLRAIVAAAP